MLVDCIGDPWPCGEDCEKFRCMGMLPIEVVGSYSRKPGRGWWCWVNNSQGTSGILSLVHAHLVFEQ